MRFLSLVAVITTFLFVTSCQKEISFSSDNPANPNPSSVKGDFKAKINGTQWTADKVAGASRMNGLINLTGLSSDHKLLTITLTDSGVHKYILSDLTMNAAALVDSNETNKFSYTTNQGTYPTEAGGEVNVTAIDTAKKTISGTFTFKMFRMMDGGAKTITEGSFTKLSYSTSLPPAQTTDTFNVKIDGVPFVPASVIGLTVPAPMNQISIVANNTTATKTVGLVFPNTITPGNYTLDFFGLTYIGQYNPDTDPNHSKASMSGTLTILEHNTTTHRIRGNFNFRAEELLNPANFANLTEGYFSVRYQ